VSPNTGSIIHWRLRQSVLPASVARTRRINA
jgi:hypothetical protein